METELYRGKLSLTQQRERRLRDQTELAYGGQEERLRLLSELGLTAQVQRESHRVIPYPLLSNEERHIWWKYLPMGYASGELYSNTPRRTVARHLKEYDFDRIPFSILEEWKEAEKSNLFEFFMIRTPEKVQIEDPILLGVNQIGTRWSYSLIGRWGESLKPFEEIRQLIMTSWQERLNKFRYTLLPHTRPTTD